jgi:hypothetical protein
MHDKFVELIALISHILVIHLPSINPVFSSQKSAIILRLHDVGSCVSVIEF